MRSAALVLACLMAIAACGGGRVHSIVIPATGIGEPLPVEVVDAAGIVTSIELNQADLPPLQPIAPVDGDRSAVWVSWSGGLCDTATRLRITREGKGLRISEATTRPGACRLAAIYRTLLFRLVEPVPLEAVTFVPEF